MVDKSLLNDRLQKMEPLSGILPTAINPSEQLSRVAKQIRRGDSKEAAAAVQEQLDSSALQSAAKSAASELYEDAELREQVAGFAAAGINLFHTSEDYWKMSRAQRSDQGGNGAVTRVYLSNQRLLMETSRIVIRFAEGMAEDEIINILREKQVTYLGNAGLPPNIFRADDQREQALQTCLELMELSSVEYSEPEFLEHIGQRYTPSDPDFNAQWHHRNIHAEAAWEYTKGSGIRVAVVDNGFETTHPDLRFGSGSGWFRPSFDFADADFVPGTNLMPTNSHGTACAGMIASPADNGNGGCGVAFEADINMVACLPDQVGSQVTLARAIAYAASPAEEGSAEEGADIISCSLGPNGAVWSMSNTLEAAINFAATEGRGGKGCPIFWACTNGNHPIASDEVCSHPEVMAIGRSTDADSDNGSGSGPKLEFLAPGVDVWIPNDGGGYQTTTGTSFAAPCSAGIGALALSKNTDLTAVELRQVMRDSCDKVGPLPYVDGQNIRFGHGRINAELAVSEAIRLATGL